MVFEIFLKFSDSLVFLGFKTWNYTVRWLVNGTILKGFDAMAPFFGALLVFSSTLSWWEMVQILSRWEMVLFGGVEADSSPEEYHFRGDRTQNDEDISRSLTLKPSIYIHDLSEIIFMYTVHPCTLGWYRTDHWICHFCRILVTGPLLVSPNEITVNWKPTNWHFWQT